MVDNFEINYFERNRINKFIGHTEIDLCGKKVYNMVISDKSFVVSTISLIDKIDKGYNVKDLSKEETLLFEIIEDLYNISDDEYFIKFPLIKALKEVLSKDIFEFFFNNNGELDKEVISKLQN